MTNFFNWANPYEKEIHELKANNHNLSNQYYDSLNTIKVKEISLAELLKKHNALHEVSRSQEQQINFLTAQTKSLETEMENLKLRLKNKENQEDWETKFKNLTSFFTKNQNLSKTSIF